MEWQPISTAPKDGTEILGARRWDDYWERSAIRFDGKYWYYSCDEWPEGQGRTPFTHWMPLPEPPEED